MRQMVDNGNYSVDVVTQDNGCVEMVTGREQGYHVLSVLLARDV